MCKDVVYRFTCGHDADPDTYGKGVDKCGRAQNLGYNCSVRKETISKSHPVEGVCEECEDAEDEETEREKRKSSLASTRIWEQHTDWS